MTSKGVCMSFSYEIQYTKAADKFFQRHENIRTQFEDAIRELLCGDHPDRIDVKKIRGSHAEYYRIRKQSRPPWRWRNQRMRARFLLCCLSRVLRIKRVSLLPDL